MHRTCATTATALLLTAAHATAQPRVMPTPRQAGGIDLLVISPAKGPLQQVPRLLGSFGLDPATSAVLPIDRRAGLPVNTADRAVYWQIIERDAGTPGGALSPVFTAEPGQRVGDPAQQVPVDVMARAQEFVGSVAGGELAPNWTMASLPTRAVPLQRPDLGEPAYWEFAMQPSGYLIMAAGDHDFVVPHWSAEGSPRTELLLQRAEAQGHQATAFYKLDTLAYAGEDAAGRRAGHYGDQPNKLIPQPDGSYEFAAWHSWHEMKREYATVYSRLIQDLRQQCAPQWRGLRSTGGMPPEASYSSWRAFWAGNSGDQRYYNQWQENGVYIGCGPVAWMMLFGWGDYRASVGDPTWQARRGLYRSNGSRTGSASTVAPVYINTGIRNATREINQHCRTFALGNNGATYPWDMPRASSYLSGRTGATIRTGWHSAGLHTSSLRNTAASSIRYRDTPAVIGTGWLNHYPLAWGYKYRSRTDFWGTTYERFFYVNQGWGGAQDGWIQAGTWFAGELRP